MRMTAKWRPLFYDAEGHPVFEMEKPVCGPVLQKVPYSRILRSVTLTQYGVMQAADMRALDTQGWTPQTERALGYSILGKLDMLDPQLRSDAIDDGFGGHLARFHDKDG